MKHKFSKIEKFIVWETHDKICYWCGEPLTLKTTSIDHVIPEDLERDIESIKKDYSLPGNFEINSFCNWVPAHNNCNSKKSFNLFEPSPVFLAILNDIIKKSIKAYEGFTCLKNEVKVERTLGRLLVLVDENKVSEEEIINKLGYKIFKEEKITELGLNIPSGWKVEHVDQKQNIVKVSHGTNIGLTIIPDSSLLNPWWTCVVCGNDGPWSGSLCLSCGHYNSHD